MRTSLACLFFLRDLPLTVGRSWILTPSSPIPPSVVYKDFVSGRSIASSTVYKSPAGSGSHSPPNSNKEEGELKNVESGAPPKDSDEARTNFVSNKLSNEVASRGNSTIQKEGGDNLKSAIIESDSVDAISINSETTDSPETMKGRKWKRREKKRKKKDMLHSGAKYTKKLKNRNNLNIRRKIMHANFGLFFAGLNHFIPRNRFVPGMTILTTATLVMELLRYRKYFGWINDLLHFVLGSSLRKHEMEGKFTGSFYYFLGVTATAALFPTTCATMGICQLALADPSASYFGRQTRHVYWSRIENGLGGFGRNKGFLGFLGGALFCFPFNYRVLSLAKFGVQGVHGGKQALVFASLALGFAGAFADLAVPTPALQMPEQVWGIKIPPFHVDDNFVVPVVSGYACTKVFGYLEWAADLQLTKFVLF